MRILIDGRSITPKISGIGRYTDELIKGYIKHYGYDNVAVILNEEKPNYPYNIICCSYNRHTFLGSFMFTLFLRKQEYNTYHSGDTIGPFWHNKKKNHIITVHDLMFLTVSNFYGKETLRKKLRILKNKLLFFFFLKDADEIISISKTTHDDLFKYFRVGSIILREGINKINHNKESITSYLNLERNSFFLYVGLGAPHKNINLMIEAFLHSNTDKKLVICGQGHKIVESDRIMYTGWVDDSELNFLYANCAAFIFPSLYEGFGLPILEALSYYCKVFSSNAGSLNEFSEKVIEFFNPKKKEQLIELIENVDNFIVNKEIIDSYLSQFNWEEIWDEFHSKFSIKKQ